MAGVLCTHTLSSHSHSQVWLYPAVLDFATVDASGERHAVVGDYTISFGVAEAAAHGMGFVSHRLRAV